MGPVDGRDFRTASRSKLPAWVGAIVCASGAEVGAFVLTLIGAVSAIAAAVLGICMKAADFRMVDETGRAVFGGA